MISKETCEEIWHCHREIETAENLIVQIEELIKKNKEDYNSRQHAEKLKDVFGRERNFELRVPNGENSKRLFGVSYDLAVPVITAHIASKKARIVELNEIARLELGSA